MKTRQSLINLAIVGGPWRANWQVLAFLTSPKRTPRSWTLLSASGQGFGNPSPKQSAVIQSLEKTYGLEQQKIKDVVIDTESAMNEFFSTNVEWHPLFAAIMSEDTPAAHAYIQSTSEPLEYDSSSPWKQLSAIPSNQQHMAVVGTWLDSVQASLLSIPVDESHTHEDDALDTHFIMEGKRMLATSRFHVLQRSETLDDLHHHETLFMTCWSELATLHCANQPDTGEMRWVHTAHLLNFNVSQAFIVYSGSVILLPDSPMDVKRFMDMNVLRPLQWLGLESIFEVSSFTRGDVPAIRLLHKLSDVPTNEELQENRKKSILKNKE